jgi:hypothetical protein
MKALLAFTLLLLSTVITSGALAQEIEGQISGIVVDAAGKPLADQRVELRRPSREGPGQQVATTAANGAFTYTRLRPGRYEVELVSEGRVVARSGPIELSDRATRVTGVILTRPTPPPTWVHTDRQVMELPRVSAKQLLGAQAIATSFAALQAILKPGHRVVFTGGGAPGGGREVLVAEVSPDRLVLVRRRLFRTQELILTEDAVRRIDIVDPPTKGALLGAAVGASLGLAAILQTRHDMRSQTDCNLCPLGYVVGAVLIGTGPVVGASIDLSINEPIYERPSQTRRVSFVPLLGRERIGLMARVHF